MVSLIANIITLIILIIAVTGACVYIYRENRKGRSCAGCPLAPECTEKKGKQSAISANSCGRDTVKPECGTENRSGKQPTGE
jgi:hypothetical protein